MRKVDLHDIVDSLGERYLARHLEVDISWDIPYFPGMHCYAVWQYDEDEEHNIVVHPALQLPWVPLYYLRDVVWHEICHMVLYDRCGDCFLDHGPEFRVLESLHRDRLKAASWEKTYGARLTRVIENWKPKTG